MLVDSHLYIPLHFDRVDPLEQFIDTAAEKGISPITFLCHLPVEQELFEGPLPPLNPYIERVQEAASYAEKREVVVLLGVEVEISPEKKVMEQMDVTLNSYPFDFILGSLHPHFKAYEQWLQTHGITDDFSRVEMYFRYLEKAVATRRYHSISHPDLICRYTTKRFDPAEHEGIIRQFLLSTLIERICIEINTSGLNTGAYEVHPDPLILEWAAEMGVGITLGSGAQKPDQIGQSFEEVIPLLRTKGFQYIDFYRRRRRCRIPLSDIH